MPEIKNKTLKVKTAIVLAGGFGTRLQAVVKELPKPMADINGKPFLKYLFDYLITEGITECILSVGYKWETIQKYFGTHYENLSLQYCVEEEPLGTGGAILKAASQSEAEELFIFNGDTFFAISLFTFCNKHVQSHSTLSLALKPMSDFDRYGAVITDESGVITAFEEKRIYEQGNINGGIYLLKKNLFDGLILPEKFSFEKEVMEKYCSTENFYGFIFNDYFIDIGIPEDYARAKTELEKFTHR